jgi:hypothetical protein
MQISGLILLTFGSLLLAREVIGRGYVREFMRFLAWENVPLESRVVLRLGFGINKHNFMKKINEANDKWAIGKVPKNLTIRERVCLNLPVIAVAFMIIGLILSLIPLLGHSGK